MACGLAGRTGTWCAGREQESLTFQETSAAAKTNAKQRVKITQRRGGAQRRAEMRSGSARGREGIQGRYGRVC